MCWWPVNKNSVVEILSSFLFRPVVDDSSANCFFIQSTSEFQFLCNVQEFPHSTIKTKLHAFILYDLFLILNCTSGLAVVFSLQSNCWIAMTVFEYAFACQGQSSKLTVEVPIPLSTSTNDFCERLLQAHQLPCFVMPSEYILCNY